MIVTFLWEMFTIGLCMLMCLRYKIEPIHMLAVWLIVEGRYKPKYYSVGKLYVNKTTKLWHEFNM